MKLNMRPKFQKQLPSEDSSDSLGYMEETKEENVEQTPKGRVRFSSWDSQDSN